MHQFRFLVHAVFTLAISSVAYAQSSCSASNDVGAVCSVSCQLGETAVCIPANGASMPECFCSGGAQQLQLQNFSSSMTPTMTLVDVREAMEKLLAKIGPVPVTRKVKEKVLGREKCQRVAGDWFCSAEDQDVTRNVTAQELLGLGSIDVVESGDVQFGKATSKTLPGETTSVLARGQNCDATAKASFTTALSLTMTRTAGVTITKSVSKTSGRILNLSYNYNGAQIGGSINIQEQNSRGTTTMTQESTSIVRSSTINIHDVAPHSAVVVELMSHQLGISIPFSATVVVDGSVSANDKGYKRLSDIVDIEHRTFAISGVLETSDASGADSVQYQVPFDQARCKGNTQSFEIEKSIPAGAKAITK